MHKYRNIFQENLRKDVDNIKKHISSNIYEQVVKGLNTEVQDLAKKIAKDANENEK